MLQSSRTSLISFFGIVGDGLNQSPFWLWITHLFTILIRIEEMCIEAGVKLVYLPPYSPDLNPIEEFFSELKAYIRRNLVRYEEDPETGFQTFLERCIEVVGSRKQSALGHFEL